MSKKIKDSGVSQATQQSYEANRAIRKSWGEIRPCLRIIGDGRKKTPKYKEKYDEDYE